MAGAHDVIPIDSRRRSQKMMAPPPAPPHSWVGAILIVFLLVTVVVAMARFADRSAQRRQAGSREPSHVGKVAEPCDDLPAARR
jgi:hypothetical protein